MAIKNVAVAGGTGTLGKQIVEELVKAGFVVTVLTREASKDKAVPAGVAGVRAVDYGSVEGLTAALQGQEAVVSALGSLAVGEQRPLADAAAAVGTVRRFVPSEFGVNTRVARGTTLGGLLRTKIELVDHLIDLASAHGPGFSWTGLSTGLFFDPRFVGVDAASRTAPHVDTGHEPVQSSTLPFIGRAVAAVLQQAGAGGAEADKTANRYIDVASFTPTQQQVLDIIQAETAATWNVKHESGAAIQAAGEAKLAKGDWSAFLDLLRAWLYSDGAGHAPDLAAATSGNALLGLGQESLSAVVKDWAARNAAPV